MAKLTPNQTKSLQCLVDVEELYADGVSRALEYLNDESPLRAKMVLRTTIVAVHNTMERRVAESKKRKEYLNRGS